MAGIPNSRPRKAARHAATFCCRPHLFSLLMLGSYKINEPCERGGKAKSLIILKNKMNQPLTIKQKCFSHRVVLIGPVDSKEASVLSAPTQPPCLSCQRRPPQQDRISVVVQNGLCIAGEFRFLYKQIGVFLPFFIFQCAVL